jgi:hypothetical protein
VIGPRGNGLDKQADGGTHFRSTDEVGRVKRGSPPLSSLTCLSRFVNAEKEEIGQAAMGQSLFTG